MLINLDKKTNQAEPGKQNQNTKTNSEQKTKDEDR